MEMVYIAADRFLMGSKDADREARDSEKPQHRVYLDAYWIDKYEVTNAMFEKFVRDTLYRPQGGDEWRHPKGEGSSIRGLEKHPVVNVSWHDAVAYCRWAGKRLATEAEWEMAARGTDGRKYPWGDGPATAKLANCVGGSSKEGTSPVGSYPDGASPYGVLDMAGNVWEWVNDWYDRYYYDRSPGSNPPGPSSGKKRVVRGGSWDYSCKLARCSSRFRINPGGRNYNVGFRCAVSAGSA